MDLTDKQWEIIEKFIPSDKVREDGKGRPWGDRRTALAGVLWILRTGAPWKDLPERYGSSATVHRRFQNWTRAGVMERVLRGLAQDLEQRGKIDLTECFMDGSFSAAKKGALVWARLRGERVPKSWQSQTLMVFLSPLTRKLLRLPK